MRQELGVAWEMITGQVERSFVDRRGGDGIKVACQAKMRRSFYELGGGAATLRLLTAHFNRAGNVVQVITDWRVQVLGDGIARFDNVKPATQAEDSRPMRQVLRVSNDDRQARGEDFFVRDSFERNFRADT